MYAVLMPKNELFLPSMYQNQASISHRFFFVANISNLKYWYIFKNLAIIHLAIFWTFQKLTNNAFGNIFIFIFKQPISIWQYFLLVSV